MHRLQVALKVMYPDPGFQIVQKIVEAKKGPVHVQEMPGAPVGIHFPDF